MPRCNGLRVTLKRALAAAPWDNFSRAFGPPIGQSWACRPTVEVASSAYGRLFFVWVMVWVNFDETPPHTLHADRWHMTVLRATVDGEADVVRRELAAAEASLQQCLAALCTDGAHQLELARAPWWSSWTFGISGATETLGQAIRACAKCRLGQCALTTTLAEDRELHISWH